LLIGPSGSGKSDLALRLIDRGAVLISDDVVLVETGKRAPSIGIAPNIEGQIELRGVGIVQVSHIQSASLRIIAQMVPSVERMPPSELKTELAGYIVPLLKVTPFDASAPLKVEYALRSVIDDDIWPMALSSNRPSESPFH
jgi:serine kinase of HPr protein (carbohydrate metabolism regulator)